MTDSIDSPVSTSDKQSGQQESDRVEAPSVGWGPKLFFGVFAVVLVFFWWLLIYSHGVTPHHG